MTTIPQLPVQHYRFIFRITNTLNLQHYPGSAWRGLLGHALRRTSCVTGQPHCTGCSLLHSCPYSTLFESPVPQNSRRMQRYDHIPHAFILHLPWETAGRMHAGQKTGFGLNLIGQQNLLPYLVHSARHMQRMGRTRDNNLCLHAITQQAIGRPETEQTLPLDGPLPQHTASPPTLPPLPERLHIELITPMRLKYREKMVHGEVFRFHHLFRNLIRRIELLRYFHTDQEHSPDFNTLNQAAEAVSLHEPQLHWQGWTRYSSRQKTDMKLGGLRGSFIVNGNDIAPFWPWLWQGQWLHAGGKTSMGLGRYCIRDAHSGAAV